MANEVKKGAAERLSAEYNKGYVGTGTQSAAVRGHVENVYGKVVQTSKNEAGANENKSKPFDMSRNIPQGSNRNIIDRATQIRQLKDELGGK